MSNLAKRINEIRDQQSSAKPISRLTAADEAVVELVARINRLDDAVREIAVEIDKLATRS